MLGAQKATNNSLLPNDVLFIIYFYVGTDTKTNLLTTMTISTKMRMRIMKMMEKKKEKDMFYLRYLKKFYF